MENNNTIIEVKSESSFKSKIKKIFMYIVGILSIIGGFIYYFFVNTDDKVEKETKKEIKENNKEIKKIEKTVEEKIKKEKELEIQEEKIAKKINEKYKEIEQKIEEFDKKTEEIINNSNNTNDNIDYLNNKYNFSNIKEYKVLPSNYSNYIDTIVLYVGKDSAYEKNQYYKCDGTGWYKI